jgi:hypothetical protein
MNVINRAVQTLLGYIAGLLSISFGLVAAWSTIARSSSLIGTSFSEVFGEGLD